MLCPSCGRDNPEGFRFCGHCSAPLEAEPPLAEEVRKTVTVLFCDVTGSTTLGERLDPETVRTVMRRYFDEMRSVLESHGGTVEKFIGDAVMAVFGVPVVHEDDALRAVRAAHEMRDRLQRLNKALERDHGVSIVTRTGVNTGEVVAGPSDQTLVTGDAVNVAARLEQAAQPGEILIGEDTYRLVRDAVEAEPVDPIEAKGKSEPVRALRLISAEGAEGLTRRFDAPIVGRADELRQLGDALRRIDQDRACALVTVLGPAGVGKSRLVQEFLERETAAVGVVRGRCLPYGEGITYWPIVEMVTAAAGIDELDDPNEVRGKILGCLGGGGDAEMVAERLAQLLGVAGAEAAPAETHWAIRKLLETLAASAPVVVVIDDIHWAEPALLDLIEHVAYWSLGAPILLLCDARPDLLERRPGWGAGRMDATSISLEPLSETECGELVANLLDRVELPADARTTILEAAEGNPLFVEHMVAMLIDEGVLRRDGARWVVQGDLSAVSPPASIMALLEARLERLGAKERAVIERASIEGRTFHVGSVQALGPEDPDVSEPLLELVRRDLIRPDRPVFGGEDALRFRHILIRDAAYQRIPKATRAVLHERHADWLERTIGDRIAEFEEIVGFHLELAYRLRSELGPLDAEAAGLASRAVSYLRSGSRRAADRGDARASSGLLTRVLELVPSDHPDRPRLLTDLSTLLRDTGDFDAARVAVDAAEAAKGRSPDPSLEIAVRYARLTLEMQTSPQGVADRMREAEGSVAELEEVGDDAGLAQAWSLIGNAEIFWGNNDRVLDAFSRAVEHADRAGDRALVGQASIWCLEAVVHGPTPPEEALPVLDTIAARATDDLHVAAFSLTARSRLLAMLGRVDEGRALLHQGLAILRDLGLALSLGGSSMGAAMFEEMAGDLEGAEREVRSGFEILASLGEKGYLSSAAGMLARYVAIRGDLHEAEQLARLGEKTSAADDVYSQAWWRQAAALVHARRGEHERALELAQDAAERASKSVDCFLQAGAFEDLAEVHLLAGREDDAADALGRAIAIWDRKGATWPAERLRARVAELTAL
jgi:class 3 adenylate cyclase/tetratricopeptide (TPR) repeat protein